jgi:hypothetical protein
MTSAITRLQIAKASGFRPSDGGFVQGSGQGLRDLFAPLDHLIRA